MTRVSQDRRVVEAAEGLAPDEIIDAIETWMGDLDDGQVEELLEELRVRAVGEGCRWKDVENADLACIRKAPGWDDDVTAGVLLEIAADAARRIREVPSLLSALGTDPDPED